MLTTATSNQAGSAFWPTKVDPRNLSYEFTISIGGGSGADGLAFVIADASKAAPTALGEKGGGLGFAGISGIAVAFDTWKNSANPSNNFVGISDGSAGAGLLHWLSTYTPASSLRTGTHKVKVSTAGGAIAIWLDGTKLGSLAVTLPASAYIGFSGGTGGSNDRHAVSGLTVAGEGGPKEEPPAASLRITNAVSAPSAPQSETQLTYSGSCPSAFTTAAIGNGGSATRHSPAPSRARAARSPRPPERHRLEDHRLRQRRRARRTDRLRRQTSSRPSPWPPAPTPSPSPTPTPRRKKNRRRRA